MYISIYLEILWRFLIRMQIDPFPIYLWLPPQCGLLRLNTLNNVIVCGSICICIIPIVIIFIVCPCAIVCV